MKPKKLVGYSLIYALHYRTLSFSMRNGTQSHIKASKVTRLMDIVVINVTLAIKLRLINAIANKIVCRKQSLFKMRFVRSASKWARVVRYCNSIGNRQFSRITLYVTDCLLFEICHSRLEGACTAQMTHSDDIFNISCHVLFRCLSVNSLIYISQTKLMVFYCYCWCKRVEMCRSECCFMFFKNKEPNRNALYYYQDVLFYVAVCYHFQNRFSFHIRFFLCCVWYLKAHTLTDLVISDRLKSERFDYANKYSEENDVTHVVPRIYYDWQNAIHMRNWITFCECTHFYYVAEVRQSLIVISIKCDSFDCRMITDTIDF